MSGRKTAGKKKKGQVSKRKEKKKPRTRQGAGWKEGDPNLGKEH